MIGQRTLHSFFSPAPAKKRGRSPEPGGESEVSAAKKAKEAGDQASQGALSAEQQERIRRNKEAARQLLAERNVPPGFGDSWRRQLAGEFSKPYFMELMAFVAEERKRYTVYPPPEQVFTWTQMCDIWDATSHKERGWEQFTDVVVSWLNKNLHGLVFMLWGAYAQRKGSSIDRKRHHVLQTVHPSPLSVNRGFFGCRHFSKTNEFLKKSGKKPIDWKAL
ncbi:Uracil-DNA glycosylase [Lonchura striata]|uniref:Uracil-DNA glycosylase n=1 Tax=Lonchura striata TaxID=40157 RepID=A0A218V5C6_9PASE|nr:Uracil-DNA glycosylase [Lonchura striata domestica]